MKRTEAAQPADGAGAYWSLPAEQLLASLDTKPGGLSLAQAAARRSARPRESPQHGAAALAFMDRTLRTLASPLLLILIFGALVALLAREWIDAGIVLGIVIVSTMLGSWHEHRATQAVAALRQRIAARTRVRREGQVHEVTSDEVVPGDIVELAAGSLIPADGVVLEAKDCFVMQALLTGETFPVEKQPGTVAAPTALSGRTQCLYAGTSLRSGTAIMLAVRCGADTELGRIARKLTRPPPETDFELGLRRFGHLLLQIMVLVVLAVLAVNILLERPAFETLLFAVALAVGLSPELLPAILAVTLSKGAQRMAHRGVIVRRLNAIENLGSMNVLCTDKTGTLTRGIVQLDATLDAQGRDSPAVLEIALANAALQTGLPNALDQAVVETASARGLQIDTRRKLDEIPYDFVRKRLSVALRTADGQAQLICKGALDNVLSICTSVQEADVPQALDASRLATIRERYTRWSLQGYRVLGIATRTLPEQPRYGRADEREMSFAGFLLFLDPPEPGVAPVLSALSALGVEVKIITGDNRWVAAHVAEAVGMTQPQVLTGGELDEMKDEALWHLAPKTAVFAEVDPNQKERIILALRRSGRVVGYMGDGINDAPALHTADVGVSVDNAVDVAKEAADIVLLEHDLDVLRQGIEEGRRTFANTLKYIFITTSANFGNMISMAIATLFLPFLPMLATQILLNNFLSDIPAIGIASDNVDAEWESTPHRWDIRLVRDFMIVFGLISTLFDLLTFTVLLKMADHVPELFRTGWFVESLLTELLIIFVVRTHRPLYRSRAGRWLTLASLVIAALAIALPYSSPVADWFGLVPLPASLLATLLLITLLYALASELAKRRFYAAARGGDPGGPGS